MARSMHDTTQPGSFQVASNADLWRRADLVRDYDGRTLRPVEVRLLVAYREALAGRVLELGCGAGRLTGYLIEGGADVHALDVSERMLAAARARFPGARYEARDLRALGELPGEAYDAVVAGWNVIDVVDHAARLEILREVRRLLVSGGILVFSSHNLAAEHLRGRPTDLATRHPVRAARELARMPRRIVNHRRRRGHETRAGDHAVLNDVAHDFRVLHYYIGRDAQAAQLAAAGLELVECRDLDGREVPPGSAAAGSSELHYVARRG